jgi:uncharacterized protein (DUF58 family)
MSNQTKDILLEPEFIRKLQRLQILTKKTFTGRMKGERRSKKKGISTEFADFRRYVKGDDIRFVDWNIYSRLETLFLKLFMEEEDLYVNVLIDGSRSMNFGKPTKLLFAKRVAAAIGYIALSNLDKVAMGSFGSGLRDVLKPIRGKHNTMKMLDFLTDIEAAGETELKSSFRDFVLSQRTRGIAILVSDFMDPMGFEEPIKLFMQRKFEVYVIHVLSEEEISPQLVGHLELVDSEFDLKTFVSIDRRLMNKYKDNLTRFCNSIQQYCAKRGISYIRMQNTSSVEDLVLNYLKYRGLVR